MTVSLSTAFYEVVERLRACGRGFAEEAHAQSSSIWTSSVAPCYATIICGVRNYRGEIRRDPSDTLVLMDRQALHACESLLASGTGDPSKSKLPSQDMDRA